MIIASFYAGLSGLKTNAQALGIVGENLANVNTTGFKSSLMNFSSILSENAGSQNEAGNPIQIGIGSRGTEVVANYSQGALQSTGINTQAAIDGNGFFVVNTGTHRAFTRAGNFSLDNEGYMVTTTGARVQGFETDLNGNTVISNGLKDIRVPFGETSSPLATQTFRNITNLSAEAVTGEDFQTSIEVFDSLGISHSLTLTFTKTANPGEWSYQFTMPGGTVSTTFPTQGSGTLTFDNNGHLSQLDGLSINDPAAQNRTIGISALTSGAADLSITWDLIDFTQTPRGSKMSAVGSLSSNGTLYQDGYGVGILQDVHIEQDGRVFGFFTNGKTKTLAQMSLATFNNNHGLRKENNNLYLQTVASGSATLDVPLSGGRGALIGSTLENSNVDMSEEFTKMIIHQRGYQSNSKIINTSDILMQETLNLKR